MSRQTERILFWAPRILTLLVAGFFALFSLDAFDEGYGFWESLRAFAIHLLPAIIILIFLWIAWHRELIGSLMFFSLSLIYLYMSWKKFSLGAFFVIDFPLFLISVLFFTSWKLKRRDEGRVNGE